MKWTDEGKEMKPRQEAFELLEGSWGAPPWFREKVESGSYSQNNGEILVRAPISGPGRVLVLS